MGPSLIIVKSEHSKIFGGYTDIDWKSDDEDQISGNGNSFVYSLRDDLSFIILKSLDNEIEVYH